MGATAFLQAASAETSKLRRVQNATSICLGDFCDCPMFKHQDASKSKAKAVA